MRAALFFALVAASSIGCTKKTIDGGPTRSDASLSAVATEDAGVTLELEAPPGGDAGAQNGDSLADGGSATSPSGSSSSTAAGTPVDLHPTEGGAPAGIVTFDKIDTGGDLPADAVQKYLTKNKDSYRACYGKALGVRRSTAGRLNLKVVVLPSGVVEEAEVIGGSLPPSPLIQCSVAKTKRLRFAPAPATRVTMKYEVSFSTP